MSEYATVTINYEIISIHL